VPSDFKYTAADKQLQLSSLLYQNLSGSEEKDALTKFDWPLLLADHPGPEPSLILRTSDYSRNQIRGFTR
jgi:hypothetical protein